MCLDAHKNKIVVSLSWPAGQRLVAALVDFHVSLQQKHFFSPLSVEMSEESRHEIHSVCHYKLMVNPHTVMVKWDRGGEADMDGTVSGFGVTQWLILTRCIESSHEGKLCSTSRTTLCYSVGCSI